MFKPKGAKRCTGRQVIGIGKVFRCTNWLMAYEKKLCSSCLLSKFELTNRFYDSEDHEAMDPMLREDDVVMALRKASGL